MDIFNNFMMLLAAIFLATVTKVPFQVRLELVFIHLLASIAFAIAKLTNAEIVETYFKSIARLSCLALVGYAIMPNFDLAFTSVVKSTAKATIFQIRRLYSVLFK